MYIGNLQVQERHKIRKRILFSLILFFFAIVSLSAQSVSANAFGNTNLTDIEIISPMFGNNYINFTRGNQSLNWEFPFAVTHSFINESYHVYNYEVTGLEITFAFKENEDSTWKLSINGFSSRARSYSINLRALNGVAYNNTRIIFNDWLSFDWSDSPQYISMISLDNTRLRVRLSIPSGSFSIDPSFGYDVIGTSGNQAVEDAEVGTKFTFTGGDGYVADSITGAFKYVTTSSTWNMSLWLVFENGTAVASTEYISQTYTNSYAWYTFHFITPVPLVNNQVYYLVAYADSKTGTLNIAYNGGDANQNRRQSAGFPTWYTFSGGSTYSRKNSIYCNYSTASGGDYYYYPSESTIFSDSNFVKAYFKNYISDSVLFSDIEFIKADFNNYISDSILFTDAEFTKADFNNYISDSVLFSDSNFLKADFNNYISESSLFNDENYIKTDFIILISDQITLFDNFTNIEDFKFWISEELKLDDYFYYYVSIDYFLFIESGIVFSDFIDLSFSMVVNMGAMDFNNYIVIQGFCIIGAIIGIFIFQLLTFGLSFLGISFTVIFKELLLFKDYQFQNIWIDINAISVTLLIYVIIMSIGLIRYYKNME